jgi:adenylate kinase
MGRALRDEIGSGSELGGRIRKYTDAGELVPIEITGMIIEKVLSNHGNSGVILDGFPRSIEQADLLDRILGETSNSLGGAFYLNLDDDVIVERIVNRRFCPRCKRVYNLQSAKPEVENRCDVDGEELATRSDDKAEIVANRLAVYRRETEPIVRRYRGTGLLVEIDATRNVDEIGLELEGLLRLQ